MRKSQSFKTSSYVAIDGPNQESISINIFTSIHINTSDNNSTKKTQSHQGVSSLYLFAVYCVVLACANLLADKVGQRRRAPGRQLEQLERHGDGWEVSGKVGDVIDFTIQNDGFTQEIGD